VSSGPAAAAAPVPAAPAPSPSPAPVAEPVTPEDEFEIVDGQACGIEDPECEACQ
ncbi:MAG: hypothetical protein JK586_07965, partial [Nocardiopsis sp. BM-2018]